MQFYIFIGLVLFNLLLKDPSIDFKTSNKIGYKEIVNSSIEIIPLQGIKIIKDSILLNISRRELFNIIDTSSIYLRDNDRFLPIAIFSINKLSKKLSSIVEWNEQISIDSLEFNLQCTVDTTAKNWKEIYLDSLTLKNIVIKYPLTASLYDSLEIGDSHKRIQTHYNLPHSCDIWKEYSFSGIIYYIDINKESIMYGKINKIRINNRLKYH